ncbi:MAG: 4-(cytidine 5'-diphospho)-2-C-methyl-D-erythritol kinase [Actinomycetota bacterium]|nr:4-(cytidine 5'-diphospho)-2-C-methyl-D-erythritol kinase [Actinomycetota bacterium]
MRTGAGQGGGGVGGTAASGSDAAGGERPGRLPAVLTAPAKLTLSLAVTGVRPDGYHEIDAEMVTVDLSDRLELSEGDGLSIEADLPAGGPCAGTQPAQVQVQVQVQMPVTAGPDNLVARALALVGREARVHLVKRIPAGAGLGGGSADAAAVLWWAGYQDTAGAAGLGADVPFCLTGGRARVTGIGEVVEPRPFAARRFVLLLPPFGVETAAVYRAWDYLRQRGELPGPEAGGNDLEAAAVTVEPRLAQWRDVFARVSGRRPRLAGSGSTWFIEGDSEAPGLADRTQLTLGREQAMLVRVATVPGR